MKPRHFPTLGKKVVGDQVETVRKMEELNGHTGKPTYAYMLLAGRIHSKLGRKIAMPEVSSC